MSDSRRFKRFLAFTDLCVVPEGTLQGKPIDLMPFQKRFVRAVLRQSVRTAIFSTAKKSGKTTLMALLLAFFMLDKEEARRNSELAVGAMSGGQAAKLHRYFRGIVEDSPRLLRPDGSCRFTFRERPYPSAKQPETNQEFKVFPYSPKTAHGGAPRLLIMDEVGEIEAPSDAFVSALEKSTSAYDDSLRIYMSTQSGSDGTLLSNMIDAARANPMPDTVCHVHEGKAKCALDDRREWKRACPSLGHHTDISIYETDARQALALPAVAGEFRRYMLNQRVRTFEGLIDVEGWKAGAIEERPPGWLFVTGGLDLSITTDLTTLARCYHYDVKSQRLHIECDAWIPGENLMERGIQDGAPYSLWVEQGRLKVCHGKTIDLAQVGGEIMEQFESEDIEVIGYDRAGFRPLKAVLQAGGLDVEDPRFKEHRQGPISYEPAVKLLERGLVNGTITHNSNPVLNTAVSLVKTKWDTNKNRAPDKSKHTGRIDAACSMLMSIGIKGLSDAEEPKRKFIHANPWADPDYSISGEKEPAQAVDPARPIGAIAAELARALQGAS